MRLTRLEQRIELLECADNANNGAYVIVQRTDGHEARLLWVDAVNAALNGDIEAVVDGEMGELIKALM